MPKQLTTVARSSTVLAPINKYGKLGYIECVEVTTLTDATEEDLDDFNYRLRAKFRPIDESAIDLYTKTPKEWAFHSSYRRRDRIVSRYIRADKVKEVINR